MIASERYVVGLLYDTTGSHVLLQQKSHPPAQAGWFNGPGGAVAKLDDPDVAMHDLFRHTVCYVPLDWRRFATVSKGEPGLRGGTKAEVLFYRAFADAAVLDTCAAAANGNDNLDPVRIVALFNLASSEDVIADIVWLAYLGRHRDYLQVNAMQWMPVPVMAPAPAKGASRG